MIILLLVAQEPETQKINKKRVQSLRVIVDTTTVSVRPADSIYLEQKIMMNKLDSLIEMKK